MNGTMIIYYRRNTREILVDNGSTLVYYTDGIKVWIDKGHSVIGDG